MTLPLRPLADAETPSNAVAAGALGPDSVHEPLPRIFLHDTAWRIRHKTGSDREFCYVAAPGQDHHHRLSAGEVYLENGEERICLPCASRRGLISHAPRSLQPGREDVELDWGQSPEEFKLAE